MLPVLPQFPYLLQLGLALLKKWNHYPCPFPVTEDFSYRHFAEMIVSIFVFHDLDPDLINQFRSGLAGFAPPTRTASLRDWLPSSRPTRPW